MPPDESDHVTFWSVPMVTTIAPFGEATVSGVLEVWATALEYAASRMTPTRLAVGQLRTGPSSTGDHTPCSRDPEPASVGRPSGFVLTFGGAVDQAEMAKWSEESKKRRHADSRAVEVNNALTAVQFRRLAKESGIDVWERYIDGQKANAIDVAIGWAKDGIDPDK